MVVIATLLVPLAEVAAVAIMVVMEAMADIQVFKFVANLDMMLLFAIIVLMKTVPTMSLNPPSSVNPPLRQGILHLGFPLNFLFLVPIYSCLKDMFLLCFMLYHGRLPS